jgi:hypothetical protein
MEDYNLYPLEAERRLKEANESLKRILVAKDIGTPRQVLLSFLNSTKHFLFPLDKKHKGKLVGYEEWREEIKNKLANSIIDKYFYDLRNVATKSCEDFVNVAWEIQGPTTIEGPLQIRTNEGFFKMEDGRLISIEENIKNFRIKGIYFKKNPPGYESYDALSLCKIHLDNLNEILESFIKRFITNKKIGRNDICLCGSGKKYKRCHGK